MFSNELGEPYRLFHRQWQSIVLKAHGHTPTWNPRLNYQGLSDESQAVFRRIDLRWHDLRHEYASRLVEHGVPLAQVRDLLGHASITTTERYDNQTMANLQIAAAKLERGLGFGAAAEALGGAAADEVGGAADATAGAEVTARSESGPYLTDPGAPSGTPRRRKFQHSFKIVAKVEQKSNSPSARRSGAKYLKENDLGDWLGVRDDFRHYLVHAA